MPQAFSYHPWQHPRAPWDRVHADFGEWRGTHFLVVVDAYSKWPEVRRMRSTTTQHTIEVLLDIFATHGLPRVLVTDNGPQFTSIEFSNFLSSNCIAHRTSAPYHPATNGLAENMVKNVKQWLKKEDKGSSFHASITEFLRTYRVVPHTGTGKSPAEIIFGRTLRTRISMVLPNMTGSEEACTFAPARTTFHVGDTVWIRDFRSTSGNKWCKGTIKEILGALTYMVGLPEGYQRKAHLDHLRSRSIEVEDSSGSFVAGRPLSRPLPTGLPFNSVGDMCGQQQPESTVPLPYRLDNEESPMCQPSGATSEYCPPTQQPAATVVPQAPQAIVGERASSVVLTPSDLPQSTTTVPQQMAYTPQPLRRSARQSKPPKRYIEECT